MSDRAFAWVQAIFPTRQLTFQPLKAEASFRSFYRIGSDAVAAGAAQSVVLMVSPPEKEQNAQFERLARVFAGAGLPVPDVIESDPAEGWYLLTDLGRTDLAAAYGTVHEDAALELAIDALVRLQRVRDPAIGPYTMARFTDELGIFSEWFVAGLLNARLPAAIDGVFRLLVEQTGPQLQCCIHRDFHCKNLLYDPARNRLGIVDFQDALIGPVSYDLASLLHDCYHEFTDRDVERWIDFYLSRANLTLDGCQFRNDLDQTAVQRQLKAVGIFARLRLRDHKSTHLDYILPVLGHLSRLTRRHQPLTPLADWLDGLDHNAISERLAVLASSQTAPT